MKVYVPRCAKTVRKTFFSVRVCNSWNSLPQHVIEAQSTNSFKNRLDKFWSDGRMKASAAELINIKYQVSSKVLTIPFLRAHSFTFWYSTIISTSVHSGTSEFVSSAYLNNMLLLDLGLRSLYITT